MMLHQSVTYPLFSTPDRKEGPMISRKSARKGNKKPEHLFHKQDLQSVMKVKCCVFKD